jgi:urease beta subunit
MIPGEVITPDTDIELNVGRQTLKLWLLILAIGLFR